MIVNVSITVSPLVQRGRAHLRSVGSEGRGEKANSQRKVNVKKATQSGVDTKRK
ncbi:MAG: hypothetical protein ACMUEL_03235 [Flavobacteriales bacterium Tduv]